MRPGKAQDFRQLTAGILLMTAWSVGADAQQPNATPAPANPAAAAPPPPAVTPAQPTVAGSAPAPLPPQATKTPKLTSEEQSQRATKAREQTHIYKERLNQRIAQALKESGPKGAIGACTTLAPELNATLTEESSFEIARTALKVRNSDNTPDAWELKGLQAFQTELSRGTDAKKMEIYDVTTTPEGQSLFRYLRPIIMHEQCLVCHGPSVAQDVKAEIVQTYPDDKATGYNVGDLRGAFSLIQQLD